MQRNDITTMSIVSLIKRNNNLKICVYNKKQKLRETKHKLMKEGKPCNYQIQDSLPRVELSLQRWCRIYFCKSGSKDSSMVVSLDVTVQPKLLLNSWHL